MIWLEEMIKFQVDAPRMLREKVGRCSPDVLRPKPMTAGSAGFDLRADIVERVHISSCYPEKIPTGVRCEIPPGHVGLVTIRSSLAVNGVMLVNAPGIIDSDYRGEISLLLSNLTPDRHPIRPLERIAQLVIVRCPQLTTLYVDSLAELSSTERGEGGYGSTGRQ
jgi:dUTP pyrophosphatase